MILETDTDYMRHVIRGLKLKRGHAVSRICRSWVRESRGGSYLMPYVLAYTKAIRILEGAARNEKRIMGDNKP